MRLLAILGAFAALFGFIVLVLRFAIGRYIDHLSRTELPEKEAVPEPETLPEPESEAPPAPYEEAWLAALRTAVRAHAKHDAQELSLPCPVCGLPVSFSFREAPAERCCPGGHTVRFPSDPRASRLPVCRRCGSFMRFESPGFYLCMDPDCRHRYTGTAEQAEQCGELLLM